MKGITEMQQIVNGYECIVDYNTGDIMVRLWGVYHNASNALACQAYWDLYKAIFKEEY